MGTRLCLAVLLIGTFATFQDVASKDVVLAMLDGANYYPLMDAEHLLDKVNEEGVLPLVVEEGSGIAPPVPRNRWKQYKAPDNNANSNTTCNTKCGCNAVAGPPGPCGNSLKGDCGPIGPRGETGYSGDQGQTGAPGAPGKPGFDGKRGPKGRPGPTGPSGPCGDVGPCGPPGRQGPVGPMGSMGPQGLPGSDAADGAPGFDGADGSPGPRGPDGPPGPQGDQGDKGATGPQGPPGFDGRPGPQGPPGVDGKDVVGQPGCRGPKGLAGAQGPPGIDGRPGPRGRPGPDGRPGPCGDQGPQGDGGDPSCFQQQTCVQNFVYARHSQSTSAPACANPNHKTLWNGWSLLHTEDEARHFVQDLGRASSCLQQFEPMPFMFCGSNEVCTWGARTASSYWLASDERQRYIGAFGMDDSRERPLTSLDDIKRQISRCAVCVACGPLISIHSQNSTVPECPSSAWTSLWTGYSLAMHAVGPMGGGQPLESPGSCLQDFRHHPYIECTSTGQCAYYSDKIDYWLAGLDQMPTGTIDPNKLSVVAKRDQAASKVGRCRVCSLELTAHR